MAVSGTAIPVPGAQPSAPAASETEVKTSLPLVAGWDAALTYDVLESDSSPTRAEGQPVFVGREELLGSLVDAISQPDRRGTYLISGYRGAGKTSVVIEAARRAIPRLRRQRLDLLPLVLNVSEISASLEQPGKAKTPQLGIDARRLLTALLRALRNGLAARSLDHQAEQYSQLVELVGRAYEKSQATEFTMRTRHRAEASTAEVVEARRAFEVESLLKLVAGCAALAIVALNGFALLGASLAAVETVSAALAGTAVLSYSTSRKMSRKMSTASVAETQLVSDNSLHQVESDLKDILGRLAQLKFRAMFVLEELDKVEDDKGEQLDATIRYFKNLFTQAPALFFFVTDKHYFDVVNDKIADSRRQRSYAIEHTFFTHRVFVSRPSLAECLDYFSATLASAEGRRAVEQIRVTVGMRSRSVETMSSTERFLRVLLFGCQNHLFDLKNELRGYVHVDDDGPRLEFDAETFPPQEQALAAFHFLLEQKVRLYKFGGGRDYANETLRNCLSSVFSSLGTNASERLSDIYPETIGAGGRLRRGERARVIEAVDSLLSDLEQGGAIDIEGAASDEPPEAKSLYWRENAEVLFNHVPTLESHEEALQEQLRRAMRVSEQFRGSSLLAAVSPTSAAYADRLLHVFKQMITDVHGASQPLSAEEANQRSGSIVRELSPLLNAARTKHQAQLSQLGWSLAPVSSDGDLVLVGNSEDPQQPQVLLVYGPEEEHQSPAHSALASLSPGPAAIVLVDDDPALTEELRRSTLARWRTAFATEDRAASTSAPPSAVLITLVKLGEDLVHTRDTYHWGEQTSDEIVLAQMWLTDRQGLESEISKMRIHSSAWLAGSDAVERRYDSLILALRSWLADGNPLLAAPGEAGNTPLALEVAFSEAAMTLDRPVILTTPTRRARSGAEQRLLTGGRLIPLHIIRREQARLLTGAREVLMEAATTRGIESRKLSTIRTAGDAGAILALAKFAEAHDNAQAMGLYENAAEQGDAHAMGALTANFLLKGEQQAAIDWADRLATSGAWSVVETTAEDLGDTPLALRLWTASAEAGSLEAMVHLLLSPSTDDAVRDRLEGRLIQSRNPSVLLHLADALHETDPERSQRLRHAATGAERPDSSSSV